MQIQKFNQKNRFIMSLGKYLQNIYGSQKCYTYVDNDVSNKQNLRGFWFRKDLCGYIPKNKKEILRTVQKCAKMHNLEHQIGMDDLSCKIKLDNTKYEIEIYMGEGFADDISISFF